MFQVEMLDGNFLKIVTLKVGKGFRTKQWHIVQPLHVSLHPAHGCHIQAMLVSEHPLIDGEI